jgi:hypothetical protein
MKKIILALLALIVVALLAVVALASGKPDIVHVERSVTASATAADVALYADDLTKVNEWSPWEKRDPNLKKGYSDVTHGVGAWYSWEGNEDVGSGKQTVTVSEPGKVVHRLEFFEPFAGEADATLSWREDGDGVAITWAYDQDADFGTKVMTVFMDMDDMLGPDFAEGLSMLKPLVESAANERVAAENAARAAAEAAQKAEAEDAEGSEEQE